MANTTPLIVTDIDFDSTKQNLINFLQGQAIFKDYNFEGSGMNILLDVLSYGIHYHAYYTNMAANESFADTALLRDSIVSKAKELDYLPRSKSGAVAFINMTVTPPPSDTSTTQVLPKYTSFLSGPIDGTNYPFCTTEDIVTTRANTSVPYVYSNIEIREGSPFIFTYPAVSLAGNPTLRFPISDPGIDTSTLQVSVQQSTTNTVSQIFELADDITEVDANSAVFYLDGASDSTYSLQFGDGILSETLDDGNIVTISYLSCDGSAPNGANTFTYFQGSTFLAGTSFATTTLSAASGGAEEADIETIRFNALKGYAAQNRAVTVNDYEILMRQDYPFIDAISVWGGQDNDPPIYDKVFVSLKLKAGFTISSAEKTRIVNEILSVRNIVTVTPQILDPDFTYIRCFPTVHYDASKTTQAEGALEVTVFNAVMNYATSSLNNFASSFRLSELMRAIVNADPSFLGCDMDVILEKRTTVVPQVQKTYQINFNTDLRRGSSTNKIYMSPSFSTFDGFGNLQQCFIEETPGSSSGINGVLIQLPGTNYTNPEITIDGDAPPESQAEAQAVVVNGALESINLLSGGSGYSFATINISDPTGFGASATAVLSSDVGALRSYYFSDGQKIILNENAGTIFYSNGTIILQNFFPQDLEGDVGANQIKFIADSDVETIAPLRNNIITIDPNDSTAVVVTMIRE